MNSFQGFLFSVTSSKGIPNGCYSVTLSYGNETVKIGHMKKNTTPHIGYYFSVSEAEISTSVYNKLNVQVYRSDHSYSKEYLFASASVPVPSVLYGQDSVTQELSLSVLLSEFRTISCSITIQFQMIYSDSVFEISNTESHHPLLLYIEASRASISSSDWKSCYLCHVIFPNNDLFSTKPLYGVNPCL